jgi:TPR repeat protein
MKKAAEDGDAASQWALGIQYESGQGVPQNFIKAYVWYSLSAAQGELLWELASSARDDIGGKLAPSDLVIAQALAEKCFESNYKDCD